MQWFRGIKYSLINENEIIEQKDKIEFNFTKSEINPGIYKIEYDGVVTEPDFYDYNSYCEIDSDNESIDEEKEEFIGDWTQSPIPSQSSLFKYFNLIIINCINYIYLLFIFIIINFIINEYIY